VFFCVSRGIALTEFAVDVTVRVADHKLAVFEKMRAQTGGFGRVDTVSMHVRALDMAHAYLRIHHTLDIVHRRPLLETGGPHSRMKCAICMRFAATRC
jgi:hypothetical protein